MQDQGSLPGLVLFLDNVDKKVVTLAVEVKCFEDAAVPLIFLDFFFVGILVRGRGIAGFCLVSARVCQQGLQGGGHAVTCQSSSLKYRSNCNELMLSADTGATLRMQRNPPHHVEGAWSGAQFKPND